MIPFNHPTLPWTEEHTQSRVRGLRRTAMATMCHPYSANNADKYTTLIDINMNALQKNQFLSGQGLASAAKASAVRGGVRPARLVVQAGRIVRDTL